MKKAAEHKVNRKWDLIFCMTVLLAFAAGVLMEHTIAYAADPATELTDPTLLYSYEGIQIWGESSYDYKEPYEGMMVMNFKIVNTNDKYKYLEYHADDLPTTSDATARSKVLPHISNACTQPSPNWLHLQPREERLLHIAFYFVDMRGLSTVKQAPFSYNIDFTVKDVEDNGREEPRDGRKFSFKSDFTVTTYAYKTAITNKKVATATVSGYVKDAKGNPVENVCVRIACGALEYDNVMTDHRGYYTAKIAPYYSKYRKRWNSYAIYVDAPGYASGQYLLTPKKNKTYTKNLKITKATSKTAYKQTKVINTNIQVYDLDASADGSVIATVPFHTLLSENEITGKTKMEVVSQTGKVYFEKELPTETPYVYVSDDGKYIVVTNEYAGSWESNAIIYDINGNELYRTPDVLTKYSPYNGKVTQERGLRCWCASLSKDNRLLALGSVDGDLWVYDWQNNKEIWAKAAEGQIRTLDFSEDGKLYVSAGGGYVYCYDAESGSELWKTFINGWGTQTVLTSKYICVTTKADGYSLFVLNRNTGKTVWDYPTQTRGCALAVSPDETMLYWGSDNGSEYTSASSAIFDLDTGKLKRIFAFKGKYTSQGGVFSSDSSKILIKTSKGFGIYNAKTGAPIYENEVVTGDGENAYSLAFSLYASPDFEYVVAGFNNDPSFRYWGQLYFFKKTK